MARTGATTTAATEALTQVVIFFMRASGSFRPTTNRQGQQDQQRDPAMRRRRQTQHGDCVSSYCLAGPTARRRVTFARGVVLSVSIIPVQEKRLAVPEVVILREVATDPINERDVTKPRVVVLVAQGRFRTAGLLHARQTDARVVGLYIGDVPGCFVFRRAPHDTHRLYACLYV